MDPWTGQQIGHLAQGVRTCFPAGTKTIHFIKGEQVPSDCKVTYGRIVATICPQKVKSHCYPGDVSTPTTDMTTAKILFNSVISTPRARFMHIDVKYFYLNTTM
jgi:hypothetical protein